MTSSTKPQPDQMFAHSFAMFPGQGSQHVGMAKELFESFKLVRELFEEASEAVKKDLRKLCFDGPESDLTLTENTQPALLVSSVAAFRVAQAEFGFAPGAVAGHSLGEYSALVAARAIPLATAAAWVRDRGRAMQIAVPAGQGTMAAVLGMDDSLIGKLCAAATTAAKAKRSSQASAGRSTGAAEDLPNGYDVECVVEPANFNSPGQIVIAGSTDAVAEAVAIAKAGGELGAKAMPLTVSAPFHCRLMRPARDRMASLFAVANAPGALDCAYVPNRTARLTREPGVIYELLIDQVDHPVLWKQSISALLDAGFTHGIEFGPGKVLAGLGKRIAASHAGVGKPLALHTIGDNASLKAFETILNAKGAPSA